MQECIVVCVVSLEEVEISPASVPFGQCREIRTEGVGGAKRLDNIIIPAATAIVVCVIVAVIIFIFCLKSSNKKTKKLLDEKPIHTLSMSMNGLNTLGGGGPVGAPLAGLASLGLGPTKDWDTMSMYSQKSAGGVNRARMYHIDPRNPGECLATPLSPANPAWCSDGRPQQRLRARGREVAHLPVQHEVAGEVGREVGARPLRAEPEIPQQKR